MSPVLFSDALVKVLNIDEYKLNSNINNNSKISVVLKIGTSALLSVMAKTWRSSVLVIDTLYM